MTSTKNSVLVRNEKMIADLSVDFINGQTQVTAGPLLQALDEAIQIRGASYLKEADSTYHRLTFRDDAALSKWVNAHPEVHTALVFV